LRRSCTGVDVPVTQERPDAPHLFAAPQIDISDQRRGAVDAGLASISPAAGDEANLRTDPDTSADGSGCVRRLVVMTGRLLAMACALTVIHASRWRDFSASVSRDPSRWPGEQQSAPLSAMRRAALGTIGPSTSITSRPTLVLIGWKPRSPGVK
jgi:hypothetical protein